MSKKFEIPTDEEIGGMTKSQQTDFLATLVKKGYNHGGFSSRDSKEKITKVALEAAQAARATIAVKEADKKKGEAAAKADKDKGPEKRASGFYTVDALPDGGCIVSFGAPNLTDMECKSCPALTLCQAEAKAKDEAKGKTVAKTGGARKGAGFTPFGHNRAAISGKIDLMLMADGGATVKEVAEALECSTTRVVGHINRDLKIGLRNNGVAAVVEDLGEGKYFISVASPSSDETENKETVAA